MHAEALLAASNGCQAVRGGMLPGFDAGGAGPTRLAQRAAAPAADLAVRQRGRWDACGSAAPESVAGLLAVVLASALVTWVMAGSGLYAGGTCQPLGAGSRIQRMVVSHGVFGCRANASFINALRHV